MGIMLPVIICYQQYFHSFVSQLSQEAIINLIQYYLSHCIKLSLRFLLAGQSTGLSRCYLCVCVCVRVRMCVCHKLPTLQA